MPVNHRFFACICSILPLTIIPSCAQRDGHEGAIIASGAIPGDNGNIAVIFTVVRFGDDQLGLTVFASSASAPSLRARDSKPGVAIVRIDDELETYKLNSNIVPDGDTAVHFLRKMQQKQGSIESDGAVREKPRTVPPTNR